MVKVSQLPRLLFELGDSLLLQIFSFLRTEEVLNFAQANKFLYYRIDGIFDIQSTIVKEEWGKLSEPNDSKLMQENNAKTSHQSIHHSDIRLSKEMVEVLTKRLSGYSIFFTAVVTINFALFQHKR